MRFIQLKALIILALLFHLLHQSVFAQDACPRVWRSGDTLWTDQADAYQWYRNGAAVPGANQRFYVPSDIEPARYSVVVFGMNQSYEYRTEVPDNWKLQVRAVNRRYEPIEGATVRIGTEEAVTDANGVARFDYEEHIDSRMVVRATHAGHLNATSAHWPTGGSEQTLFVMMTERSATHTLNGRKGGTIAQANFFLTLPENAVAYENGSPYTGTVNFTVDHVRPDDEDFGFRMPGGDFLALDEQGRERILHSYGFVTVEMSDPNGQKLNIAQGKTAKLRFNIAENQRQSAPLEMPFWHFDEADGLWKEVASFSRSGNAYEGVVSHFSSWNCDVPFDRCTVKGRLLSCVGSEIANGRVQVGQRQLLSDNEGKYITFAPADLSFDVSTESTEQGSEVKVGPFPGETTNDLGDINTVDFWGYGVVSSNGELNVFSNDLSKVNNVELNNGVQFQPGSPIQISFDNRPTSGTMHGENNCQAPIRLYYQPEDQGNCMLLDTIDIKRDNVHNSMQAVIGAQNTVYRINMRSGTWTATDLVQIPLLAPCVQELNAKIGTGPEFWAMLGQLTSLQDLDIERNNLTVLPDAITNLTNLIVLDLEHNRFNEVPPVIQQMDFLRNIKLEGNPITELPGWFYDMPKLESLDLSLTQIRSFPDDIGKLADTLRALGLYGLNLPPQEITRLRQLLPNTQFFL